MAVVLVATITEIPRVLPRRYLCYLSGLFTRCDHTAEESSSTANPRVGFIVCGPTRGHVPVDGAAARPRGVVHGVRGTVGRVRRHAGRI